ncbi:MAG TPA: hypothetical protein VGW80_02210 [Solirubrobacterales bacterium]|nr:hypothetical protein [Solirubrobacterales bacterium]
MSNLELQIDEVVYLETNGGVRGLFKAEAAADRLRIFGWAFAQEGPVAAIEVVAEGNVVATAQTGIPRPDVAERFDGSSAAATSGFEVIVEADGEGRSALEVEAVLDAGDRHALGRVEVLATGG